MDRKSRHTGKAWRLDRRHVFSLIGAAAIARTPVRLRHEVDMEGAPTGSRGAVTLFLCGDVMLGRGIDQVLPTRSDPRLQEPHVRSALRYVELAEAAHGPIPKPVDYAYVWGDALAALERANPALRIVNLETSITTSEQAEPKGINYRMHPDNVRCLQAARIDACVLANNHVLDWGRAGLAETLATLDRAGIRRAGAGGNAAEASGPARCELTGGRHVLVFGFGAPSSGVPPAWAARADRPGVNFLPDLSSATVARIVRQVEPWRRAADILIASIHWGANWGYDVSTEERRFAHALIDVAGFDLVHGHSSHHPKALEVHSGKLVLYGCGDFVNDYEGIGGYEEFRPELVLMYLPRLSASTGDLDGLTLVPFETRRFRLVRASASDTKWLRDVLDRESAALGTRVVLANDDSLALEWK